VLNYRNPLSSHPPHSRVLSQRKTFANVDDFIYTREPTSHVSTASRRNRKRKKKKKGKNDGEKSEEDASYILSYNAIRFVFYIRPQAISPFPAPLQLPPIPPMRRVCTFARFIPVKRRQPGLFWSLLPLKLAKEIIAARHDFIHERRGEERIGYENGEARLWRDYVV